MERGNEKWKQFFPSAALSASGSLGLFSALFKHPFQNGCKNTKKYIRSLCLKQIS
jgi:hypothetical protein